MAPKLLACARVAGRPSGETDDRRVDKNRIVSIDFWRGVALAVILVNHIPGNVLGAFTPRNFGFSDAAELFVFLSGVSVFLAYGGRVAHRSAGGAVALLALRALRLYGVHVTLTLSALALFWFANDFTANDLLASENGRATPFLDPLRGLLGILALSHQVAYFNILPLYIVLVGLAPLLLALALRDPRALLAVSATIYVAARSWGLNLPSWPEPGVWYFNPFAWQLMFVLGILYGCALRGPGVPYHGGVLLFSRLFTVAAALVVSNLFGLAPGLVDAAGGYLDWDKTDLGLVRVLDFLTLAYCIRFSSLALHLSQTALFDYFASLGRNALLVFCAASLLSAFGQIVADAGLASPVFDVLYVAASLALLGRLARVADRARPRLDRALGRRAAPDHATTD
jgi:hypothetical protein